MRKIPAEKLIPMDAFADRLSIDLVYANPASPLNIFGAVYRPQARLWLHESLAQIVALAGLYLKEQGFTLLLYDGLRTVEAQERMANSPIARANPRWLQEPGRLLSPPGAGAHPRGMAIDMTIAKADGTPIDMGTPFDYLAPDPSPETNPAHRAYIKMSEQIRANREILNNAVRRAAGELKIDINLLAEEWWDFRLPASLYKEYAPISDADLPPSMRMTA